MPSSINFITLILLVLSSLVFLFKNGLSNAEQSMNIFADEIELDEIEESIDASGDAILINEGNCKQ